MPERDWAKDWKIATSLPETVELVYCANRQEVVVIGIDATNPEQRRLVMDWLDIARKGWPAALKERARLEQRVRELEEENRRLKAVVEVVKEYLANTGCDYASCEDVDCASCAFYKLREALAVLEEAKD